MTTYHITYIVNELPLLSKGKNYEADNIYLAIRKYENDEETPGIDKIVCIVNKD